MKHHYYQQIKKKKVKRSFEDEVRTKPPVKVDMSYRTPEEWQEIMKEARRKNG
jgi:hypothetical protein